MAIHTAISAKSLQFPSHYVLAVTLMVAGLLTRHRDLQKTVNPFTSTQTVHDKDREHSLVHHMLVQYLMPRF